LFRFSGGESYWIDLSIRAALFLVWRVRNPDNVLDLLMVDEGMGKIDDEKRRVLIDVLKYLSTKVKRILIITHTDLKNLVEEFDNVITIKKINDVSGVG
jgi:DNA repair exonuclease SbcCD ATPase subunit